MLQFHLWHKNAVLYPPETQFKPWDQKPTNHTQLLMYNFACLFRPALELARESFIFITDEDDIGVSSNGRTHGSEP